VDQLVAALNRMNVPDAKDTPLETNVSARAYQELLQSFDAVHGGFGDAPKFPSPHKLLFLLRYWHQTGEKKALDMVEKTLAAMRAGGMYDQIGFGFHRYSTDNHWLLPHFEKMLYDQAMLIMAYAEAYQATGKAEYADTAREIIEYVLRDMRSPQGGFYSAEDADSEGVEGKFYVWAEKEMEAVLGKEDAAFVASVLGVTTDGNMQDEATGQKTGANVLHLEHPPASGQDKARLESIRKKLFAVRKKRIHPFRDDKILTDWNGMMIAALAIAGRNLNEPAYTGAARKAAASVPRGQGGTGCASG